MRSGPKQPPREPALPYAVKLLSARSYSTRKLRDKLRMKGYLAEEIDAAIEKLKEKRLLDDERYADGFVRSRIETHPRGKSALVRDLLVRGVSGSTAKQAVNDNLTEAQEFDLARDLVARKGRQYDNLDPDKRKRRLIALLSRRGFRPGTIFKVLALPQDESLSEDTY